MHLRWVFKESTYTKIWSCKSITGWHSCCGGSVCIEGIDIGEKCGHEGWNPSAHVFGGQTRKMSATDQNKAQVKSSWEFQQSTPTKWFRSDLLVEVILSAKHFNFSHTQSIILQHGFCFHLTIQLSIKKIFVLYTVTRVKIKWAEFKNKTFQKKLQLKDDAERVENKLRWYFTIWREPKVKLYPRSS